MIVVVAIILIITVVVLSNLPAFRDKTSLDLLAQEMAITIRQAQVFGISTKTSGGGSFPSFGIHFDDWNTTSGQNGFVLFADVPPLNQTDGNNVYDVGSNCGTDNSTTECREHFFFRGGVKITNIVGACPSCSTPNSLNIVFKRPDTDARFFDDSGGAEQFFSNVKITISKGSDTRCIYIYQTGHIYASTCP